MNRRDKYLIILMIYVTLFFPLGCARLQPYPVCRHSVVGDALYVGETYEIVQIAVDPTIAKHAQVRYFDKGRWHWYHEVEGWLPEVFNPVLFFNVEDYIVWYKANYHKISK